MSQPPIPEIPVAGTLDYGVSSPRRKALWLGILSAIALAVGAGFFVVGVGYTMGLPIHAPELMGVGAGFLVFGGICMGLYRKSNAYPGH